ncbi:MAG: T9SS type A sorting domain-containing protein [bacterium]|nr:T9SS type A sorting domain-containing protein [bacterium]
MPWLVDSADFSENSRTIAASPITIALGYPYPNPFNSSVTIEYALAREQAVRLKVYDVQGKLVSTLLEETQGMGVHRVVWDAEDFATGSYFARLEGVDGKQASQVVKLMLIR